MKSVTNSMGQVVKGMDKAMESMNLERVSLVSACWERRGKMVRMQGGKRGCWNLEYGERVEPSFGVG
jgi:hypothetical protein